jgi:para-aminobenzoate synthetase component 1
MRSLTGVDQGFCSALASFRRDLDGADWSGGRGGIGLFRRHWHRGGLAGDPYRTWTGRKSCTLQPPARGDRRRAARRGAPALARAEAARAAGAWVAGYVAYEAGYALEPKLRPPDAAPAAPGRWRWGCSTGPRMPPRRWRAADEGRATRMTAPEPHGGPPRLWQCGAQGLRLYRGGRLLSGQPDLPDAARLATGTALGLYGAFRRTGAVGHGAFVDLGVGPVVVSRSPELFFQGQGGRIVTRPMKGTRPRGGRGRGCGDHRRTAGLRAKDRAENLMIVDLLRNDISRLARVGIGPGARAFRDRNLCDGAPDDLDGRRGACRPLGPAGADGGAVPLRLVTGAPKIRAMEIIREVEPTPRGVYCGAVGWMSPDGRADFSVAIRTLSVSGRTS